MTRVATDLRKVVVLAVLGAVLLAMLAGTAAAKDEDRVKTKTFNFKGTVAAVAEDGSSVSVEVTGGNKRAREAAEGQAQPMVFPTSADTDVEIDEQDAAMGDLVVGDPVKVQSKAPEGASEFPARHIRVEHSEQEDG